MVICYDCAGETTTHVNNVTGNGIKKSITFNDWLIVAAYRRATRNSKLHYISSEYHWSSSGNKSRRNKRHTLIGNKEAKMAFPADMTAYEENPKESTWKLLDLKSEFSKITECTRGSIVFFTISTKRWGKEKEKKF